MKWHRKQRHRIVIVSPALAVIEAEARAALSVDKERGGSLVGIQNADTSFILYAIPTGPNAETSWGQIITDADFQNRHLVAISSYYEPAKSRLGYLADYHIHQMGLAAFSSVDENAFKSILFDRDHSGLCGLPVILTTFRRGMLVHLPHWITRAGNSTNTEVADLEIVTSADSRVKTLLKGITYASLDEIMSHRKLPTGGAPEVMHERQVALPVGDILMTRLTLEMDAIKATFSIQPQLRRTRGGYPCIVAQVGVYRFYAVIPSEFPLNPASVFYSRFGPSDIKELYFCKPWNSISRIADVFEDFFQQ